MYRKTIWREMWVNSMCDPAMPCRIAPEDGDGDLFGDFCDTVKCPFRSGVPKFLLYDKRSRPWYWSTVGYHDGWPRERPEISHPETVRRLAIRREHNLGMFRKRTIIRLRERLARERGRTKSRKLFMQVMTDSFCESIVLIMNTAIPASPLKDILVNRVRAGLVARIKKFSYEASKNFLSKG